MPKGYAVIIEDGQGNTKKYFTKNAKTHEQGNALASILIKHLGSAHPTYRRFSTRSVKESDGGVGYEVVNVPLVGVLRWP